MPDQPDDIETRIGVIVDQHHAEPCGTDGTGLLLCWCSERFHNFADHSMHVAEVLVSELGMTAEWALTSGGGRQKVMSERSAKDKAQRWPESFGVASRYVTAWSDE